MLVELIQNIEHLPPGLVMEPPERIWHHTPDMNRRWQGELGMVNGTPPLLVTLLLQAPMKANTSTTPGSIDRAQKRSPGATGTDPPATQKTPRGRKDNNLRAEKYACGTR